MLEVIEIHCSEMLCQSLWICPLVSASLRGTARSPPVTLVSLGFFLADLFFTVGFFGGRRDFFRAIVLLLLRPTPGAAPAAPRRGGRAGGRRYGVLGTPRVYFVDRRGNLVGRLVGARDWESPAARKFGEQLLEMK